ncbi:MAG: hypothetical protein DCF29_14910 [Alphaproteobacteria bacterium]|nr:MAG: hypothetical protein DCF29_14910 [Alphaproteobacteria bacterium]
MTFRAGTPQSILRYRAALQDMIVEAAPTLFITLAFNRKTSSAVAARLLAVFDARVARATVGRFWVERVSERPKYIAVVENAKKNLHLHLVVTCTPAQAAIIIRMAEPAWAAIVPAGSADIRVVYNEAGLGSYMSKQAAPEHEDRLLLSRSCD